MASKVPDAFPLPPKPEWFFRVPTNMHTIHNQAAAAPVVGPNGNPHFFPKMQVEDYYSYLSAFDHWETSVERTCRRRHDVAVAKRSLAKYHESTTPKSASSLTRQIKYGDYEVNVQLSKKVVVPPTLSVKPHRAAKRAAKVQLVNAKAKSSAEILSSRSTLVEQLVEEKKASISGIAKINVGSRLSYARVAAAKVATAHAKVINLGSPDVVANILPDENWKIVTRKKGDFKPSLTEVKRLETGSEDTFSVSADPSVPGSLVLKQAVRQMNISG
jgi:hypothetical protein